MRLSRLSGKELVTLPDCDRLGFLGDCDISVDDDGRIVSLIIPENRGQLSFLIDRRYLEIPWERIKIVGGDMILIDFADIL